MSVESRNEDWMIWGDSVDHRARRESDRGPEFVIPIAPRDPTASRDCLCVPSDSLRKFFGRTRIAKLHAGELKAAAGEMNVIVDEAGSYESLTQINLPRRPASKCTHFLGRSDREHVLSSKRDGFDETRSTARPDPAVIENEIRHSIGS